MIPTLLATAATGAGLLGPSTDRVLVGPDDDPAAVAAALGRDVELVVGSRTLPAGRALSRSSRSRVTSRPSSRCGIETGPPTNR